MKFFFKISKTANFFFFVANLSEWHFSCRKEYNRLWKDTLPPFSGKERRALRAFGKILKRYERTEKGINAPLFTLAILKGNLRAIAKNIKKSDAHTLVSTLQLFRPRFQKLWREAYPRLKKFSKLIAQPEQKRLIHRATKLIEIYFGKPKCGKIEAFLLFAPPSELGGGGANIGPRRVTMEVGSLASFGDLRAIDWASRTLLHEVTHICFQEEFKTLLRDFVRSLPPRSWRKFKIVRFFGNLEIPLKELITSSIIGEGLIDELVFKFPSIERLKKDITRLDWTYRSPSSLLRKSASLALRPLNKHYLAEKRKIDLRYLQHAWKFLKKFEEKYKKGKIKELAHL